MGTREEREGQLHLWFHCVGIRVAISWKGCCGAVFRTLLLPPHLAFAEQFFAFAGDEWAEREAGDRFVALDSPFNHCEQGKMLFPGCALSLPSTTKNSTLLNGGLFP